MTSNGVLHIKANITPLLHPPPKKKNSNCVSFPFFKVYSVKEKEVVQP